MKYDEALEVVGGMKYSGVPKSRYLEMLIYFEQGEYDKVRNALKGKRIDNVEEREFYLASLIELQLYDEFENYYSEYESISGACLLYIEYLLKKRDRTMNFEHKAVMDYPTYFDRRFRWYAADVVTDIFNLNEEKLMLIEADMPMADINELTRKIMDCYEQIKINDAVKVLIQQYTDSNESIPVDNVLYFPLLYFVPADKLDDVFKRYEELKDIAGMLELTRKIHLPGIETDAVSRYWKEISEAIKDGNMYIINLVSEIYADVGYLGKQQNAFGMESIIDKIYSALEKDAPYIIHEIEGHVMDKGVEETLTDKGRFCYRASGWKLCTAISNNSLNDNEHVLSLSFLRLLELEINERLIYPLCRSMDIRQKYEEFKSKLNDADKGEFAEEWSYRVSCLEKVNPYRDIGLRFAGIMTLFDSMRFKRYKRDSSHREFAADLRSGLAELLTEEGRTALADGTLVKMVEPKKLEEFRNNADHVRNEGLESALACRKYVEQELLNLARFVKKPDGADQEEKDL